MVARAVADSEINKMAAQMNAACGASIGVKIDWDSFGQSDDWKQYSMPSFCGAPLDTLKGFCQKENAKAYIQKNVKTVTCYYGGQGKRALQVEKGAIKNTVDFEAPNLDQFLHAALLKEL